MRKTLANEALLLSEEILADLELSRIPLSNACMKICRLARILGETKELEIFRYELSGYPTTPNGVGPEIWELCRKAGRIRNRKDEKSNETKKRANLDSIEKLEERKKNLAMRLEFGRPQPVSLSSSNPNQYLHTPSRNVPLETSLSSELERATQEIAGRKAYFYNYCLEKNISLRVSGAAEDIFEAYRRTVDKNLTTLIPQELQRLDSISENLNSINSEDWANALHSCRRLLQGVADAIYPPKNGESVNVDGKQIKIGSDNYINRIILYCQSQNYSTVYNAVVGSNISFLGDRLDAIFSAAQKGSHAQVTLGEAQRYVLYTYMTLGDVLMLTEAADPSSISEISSYREGS